MTDGDSSHSSSSSQGRGRAEATLRSLYLLVSLAYSLWIIWAVCIPAHQKTAMRMRLLRSSHRATSGLARRAAERSMHLELATARPGRPGMQAYDLPLWLSCRALDLERAYERTRGVT